MENIQISFLRWFKEKTVEPTTGWRQKEKFKFDPFFIHKEVGEGKKHKRM